MMNIINGVPADNAIDIQEFMIMPVGADTLPRPAHGRRGVPPSEKGLVQQGLSTNVGDEGGFAPT